MGTAYTDYSARSTSEKLVLCWIEPSERLLIWTLDSGAIYTRASTRFIVDILESTTSLTEVFTTSLNSGEWYYDADAGTCYIRTSDDANPNTKNIIATYRLFYANAPIDLPSDLLTASDVHYEGALISNSAIVKQLDDEQTGVSLESNTSLSLNNASGLFDDIYDTIFWENKRVRLYSWNDSILMSEKQLLFDGIIQDKTFSTTKVGFKCKDFVFKLREPLSLELFSNSDGSLSDTYLYTPKRRVYGQVDQMKCVPIDNILDGYSLTGTIAGAAASTTLTGTGTAFLDECSPSDKILIPLTGETIEATIESVDSDTSITLSSELDDSFTGISATNSPNRPWRKKNRSFHIAGHKLRAPSTTVSAASQPNRFTLTSVADLFAGDVIDVAGETAIIKRISGDNVVLTANLQAGTPSVSDVVTKDPVTKAYFGNSELIINRDYTVSNTTEAIINIDDSAEVNISRSKIIDGTLTFTNGSRSVTATGVDLVNEVESRDWISSSDITHTTFYEVLSVTETSLELRIVYTGANNTGTAAKKKKITLIGDDALILVNTTGMENAAGAWVKTASDAVKDMLENDISGLSLNAQSFTDADIDAPYILSMVIPERTGTTTVPKIRDVITKVNESVFGSLINNSAWELFYSVLIPDKPATLTPLEDHDIIGEISVKSANKIVRKVNASYCPFVDRQTGEDTYKFYDFVSDSVDQIIGSKAEKDITLYLYTENDALEITQRIALYNSLSQSVVTIKAKMNLMLNNLNDKLYLNFDRLYRRFGGKDRRKIGIISKISKDGSGVNVELSDMGNIFNKVMSIADDSSLDFTSADSNAKIFNAYVLDDALEVPDITSDDFLNTSIVG